MKDYLNSPPPPPPAKLATLLLLAAIAWPAQAQLAPLVIPATTGTEACTEGGSSETDPHLFSIGTPTQNSLTFNIQRISFVDPFNVYVGVQEGGRGTPQQIKNLGSSQPLAAQSGTFSSLKKNTRYTVVLYNDTEQPSSNPLDRHCFKTRGEFTNAEQNLPGGVLDLTKFSRTGCYAVARTRQDITDCMCNGTRGGTRILAGQTVASQAQRQYLNCPDLDS